MKDVLVDGQYVRVWSEEEVRRKLEWVLRYLDDGDLFVKENPELKKECPCLTHLYQQFLLQQAFMIQIDFKRAHKGQAGFQC